MSLEFEWDLRKANRNQSKHGISFEEAATVFGDPRAITYFDPNHSEQEDRFLTFGHSSAGRLQVVSHTDRDQRIRIINARKLTRRERNQYEEET